MKKILAYLFSLSIVFSPGMMKIYNGSYQVEGYIKTQGSQTTIYSKDMKIKYHIKKVGNQIKVYDNAWRLITIIKDQ